MTAPTDSGVYHIKTGSGNRAGIEFSETFSKNKSFGCELFYSSLKQDSNIVNISRKDLGLGCGLSFALGDER